MRSRRSRCPTPYWAIVCTPKADAIALEGATIVPCPPGSEERRLLAETIAETTGQVLVPPYNDEDVIAGQGTIGLELLREDAGIKLLFTDMGLPGMNGRELVGEALRLRPELPVLYMTGYAEDSITEDGVSEPGAAIITKPFTRAELVKIINTVLSPADERLQ